MTPPSTGRVQGDRLPPFVANDYRKQVLAPIIKRGGDPGGSDAFELYTVPIEAVDLPDAVIIERIDEVWGFWQRHRDQPKYRVLVAQLVAEHEQRSAPLRTLAQRQSLAQQLRRTRDQREQTRFETLDAAIRRLVERYRGIPDDKVEGLCELAAGSHIGRDEAMRRIRRHRRVPSVSAGEAGGSDRAASAAGPASNAPHPNRPATASPTVDSAIDERAHQVRDLLDELGRHADGPAPTTLFDLLGLEPDAGPALIGERIRMWRARSREMPPGRVRAVIDELLAHAEHLLERGPSARAGYLDAVARDVRDVLRPRMRAAILVEDALLPEDRHYLTDEAIALGLDHARAARVVSELAAELTSGAGRRRRPVTPSPPSASAPSGSTDPAPTDARPTPSVPTPPARAESASSSAAPVQPDAGTQPPASAASSTPAAASEGEQVLRAARAALRAGRCAEAKATVDRARFDTRASGDAAAAVAAEIDEVIAAARLRWRAAVTAYEGRRYVEALGYLEDLRRTAVDLLYPGARRFDLNELLERSRSAVAAADRLVAEASGAPEATRVARLLAAVEQCAEHPEAMAQLAAIPIGAPTAVVTTRIDEGIEVSWQPSATAGVRYRVTRIGADGTARTVGRTPSTVIVDGGVAPADVVPVYVVTAHHTGRTSEEARSGQPRPDASVPAGVPAPERLAVRPGPTGVTIEWEPVAGATYKVTRVERDGTQRVVGRTSVPMIEDGGVAAGATPEYEVVALRDGEASPTVRAGARQ